MEIIKYISIQYFGKSYLSSLPKGVECTYFQIHLHLFPLLLPQPGRPRPPPGPLAAALALGSDSALHFWQSPAWLPTALRIKSKTSHLPSGPRLPLPSSRLPISQQPPGGWVWGGGRCTTVPILQRMKLRLGETDGQVLKVTQPRTE